MQKPTCGKTVAGRAKYLKENQTVKGGNEMKKLASFIMAVITAVTLLSVQSGAFAASIENGNYKGDFYFTDKSIVRTDASLQASIDFGGAALRLVKGGDAIKWQDLETKEKFNDRDRKPSANHEYTVTYYVVADTDEDIRFKDVENVYVNGTKAEFSLGEDDTLLYVTVTYTPVKLYNCRAENGNEFFIIGEDIKLVAAMDIPEGKHLSWRYTDESGQTIIDEKAGAVGGDKTFTTMFQGNYYDDVISATLYDHTVVTNVTVPATCTAAGKIVKTCKVCKKTISHTTIYKASNLKLSTVNYTYNGKVKTPSVTVKDSKGKTLKKNTDYTVSYSKGRKSIGKYAVTIKFKGNYSGTKTLYFNINPKGTKLSSVKAGKKQVTVKWKTQKTQTNGYQVQFSTSKNFKSAKTVTVNSNKSSSTTIKKLKGGKKYYFRVRTFKKVGKAKFYSAWSNSKNAKAK